MSTLTALLPLAAARLVEPVAPGWQLVLATLLGIGLIVVLITVFKVHPFLSLILGAITVGAVAGQNISSDCPALVHRGLRRPPPPASAP